MSGRNIGLFGGTFNPVHKAHIAVAEIALRKCSLDEIIFIPAASPPHKNNSIASFGHRQKMVQRAVDSPLFIPQKLILPLLWERMLFWILNPGKNMKNCSEWSILFCCLDVESLMKRYVHCCKNWDIGNKMATGFWLEQTGVFVFFPVFLRV